MSSAPAVCGQVLRYTASGRVLSDGLGGSQKSHSSNGVQLRDPMGPAMFCLGLRPELKRFREEFGREGVKTFAYMDDVSLGLMGIMANTIRALSFLWRE